MPPNEPAQAKGTPPTEEMSRFEQIITYGGYTLIGLLTMALVALAMGWLDSEEKGVYADCSRPENRDNPYCAPKVDKQDLQWQDMKRSKKSAPFSLHE